MKQRESLEKRKPRRPHVGVLPILGGAVLVLVAVGVISQLHDIRRYWNMVRM